MAAHFTVRAEPSRDLVRITLSGFFTRLEFDAFNEARAAEHARLTCGRNQHVTLGDLSGIKVQSQDMVSAFQSLLADPAFRSRKLAFVVHRSLARGQLMRALNGRSAKCFDNRIAAESWLFANDSEAAAA